MIDAATAARLAERRWKVALSTCLLVAAIARGAMIYYAHMNAGRFDYPDSHRYVAVAENIASGHGPMESEAVRCGTDPGYPFVLAIGRLAGLSTFSATMNWGRVANGVLGLFAIAAAMRLARRAGGVPAAYVTGLIMAVDPIFLFFHGLVLTEVMFTCFLLWAIEWLLCAIDTGRIEYGAISGAFLGIAALTRSSGILLPMVLLPIVLLAGMPPHRGRMVAAWFAAFVLALTPMTIRNYLVLGSFVPVRTGMGATLLDSFGDWADGGTGMQRVVWPEFAENAGELERDRLCRQTVYEWIREHPWRSLELGLAKLRRTWSVTLHAPGYQGGMFDKIAWASVAPIYALALAGAIVLRRRTALLYALLAPAIFVTVVHCVFVGSVRYRVPAMPGLFVLAATAVVAVIPKRGEERTA